MDKQKTYLVINEGTGMVVISTRFESIAIEGGSCYPLTMDEIRQVNSSSDVFKIGLLFFEKQYEADIYEDLRIHNWQEILHNDQIVDIIKNPTEDGLRKIIAIENLTYFERIRGIYVWLKNTGVDFSSSVERIILARRAEFENRCYHSQIKITSDSIGEPVRTVPVEEFEKYKNDMEKKLAELMSLVEKQSGGAVNAAEAKQVASEPVQAEAKPSAPKSTKSTKKPAANKTTKS